MMKIRGRWPHIQVVSSIHENNTGSSGSLQVSRSSGTDFLQERKTNFVIVSLYSNRKNVFNNNSSCRGNEFNISTFI